ncbi:hypothetical protein Taro_048614 [Colocasia esculenta]|uniref:Uncharacterized protein n=1 Tax=Colocasia esculenta TaxID=4460 RepID=A0A843X8K9_COLES|nr:hypothetical protein [Colocasia esculenta]
MTENYDKDSCDVCRYSVHEDPGWVDRLELLLKSKRSRVRFLGGDLSDLHAILEVYTDFVMVVSTHPLMHPTQDKSQEPSGRREEERERGICIQRSRAALPREEEGEEEGEEEKELVIAAVLIQKEIQPSLYLVRVFNFSGESVYVFYTDLPILFVFSNSIVLR